MLLFTLLQEPPDTNTDQPQEHIHTHEHADGKPQIEAFLLGRYFLSRFFLDIGFGITLERLVARRAANGDSHRPLGITHPIFAKLLSRD